MTGAFANYGMYFDGNTSTNNGEAFRFWSSDFAADPSLRPILAITHDAVPEPGSLLLLMAGLAGLGRFSRSSRSRGK